MSGQVTARDRRGFTLIELLIAISIVLILTMILAMGLRGAGEKAQGKATKALIEQIKVALENYHAEFRDYPPDGYDTETNWQYDNQGIRVGNPLRSFKGTAALMYFLCRPVVKVSFIGDPSDPRNQVRKTVGPFLFLKPDNYSREGFDPNMSWTHPDWAANQYQLTEIIDAFGKPLHYDKVKAWDGAIQTFFQPARFHFNGSTGGLPRGQGRNVHPDQEYIANRMPANDATETDTCPEGTHDGGMPPMVANGSFLDLHPDPRFRTPPGTGRPADGCQGSPLTAGFPGTGGPAGSHEPKYIGGFDVWSHGKSWSNVVDDITSWE